VASNLFLTGPSGAGKTTVLFRALRHYRVVPAGFVVKRVLKHGRRVGFGLVELPGGDRRRLLTHTAGGHVLELATFAELGVAAIERALARGGPVVMDELGRLELGAPRFLAAVWTALESPVAVVGVLKYEPNPFLDRVRARPDVLVVDVGRLGRSGAEAAFRSALAALLGRPPA